MSSPVEQIKQRLNIVDVIGSYIKLQKAGANFRAPCPFHSEKSPSFYVSPAREIWHCFGCNRGGDLFEFVKQIEGVEFAEALRILADRAGIKLKFEDPRFKNERMHLLDLMEAAAEFYQGKLGENQAVLAYLKKRGLQEKTISDFQLGFAQSEESGWRNLHSFLKSKGYSDSEMEKAGMVVKSEKVRGDYYDRFRGRIMFPLFDTAGRVVGFSGRVFGEEKEGVGKYINTPQTVLYDKSRLLYAFDRAKVEIRGKDACVLMEGQMDVIMSHQAGILNAVAVSGTALTPLHLETIKRLTRNIIMCFDGDEAGLLAAKRSIDLALARDFELRAIALPEGKDPADMVLSDAEDFKKLLDKSSHIIEFYLNVLKEKYGETRQFKQEVSKNVLPYLLSIQSGIERSHWIKDIAGRLGVKEEIVLEEVKRIYDKNNSLEKSCEAPFADAPGISGAKPRIQLLEERLAGIVLWKNDRELFPDFIKKRVADFLEKTDKALCNRLALEAELCYAGEENFGEEIEQIAKEWKKESLKEELAKVTEEIRICEEKKDKEAMEKKIVELQKLSRELAEI